MNGTSQLVLDGDEEERRREPWSADLRRVGGLALIIAVLATSAAPVSFTSTTESFALGWPYGCIPHGVASTTGAMTFARSGHTATLLRSGRVLVAGGWISQTSPNVTSSAELYDPTSGTWTATGSLNVARTLHSAVLLPSGKVLVIGGRAPDSRGSLQSAELYDPDKEIWTETGSLHVGRDSFAAVVLRSGKVFVGGGLSGGSGGELYESSSGTWSETSSSILGSFGSATLLASGKILLAGYYQPQLYDPGLNTWKAVGIMTTGRSWHTATLLPSGKVLVAGGNLSKSVFERTSTAELYDPAKGTWTPTRPMTNAHAGANAILLPSGKVVVAGGGLVAERSGAVDMVDVYDPITANWTALGPMTTARSYFTATLLRSGVLLLAGGESNRGVPHASAEIYDVTCALR